MKIIKLIVIIIKVRFLITERLIMRTRKAVKKILMIMVITLMT